MANYYDVLDDTEKIIYALRSLYAKNGYTRYRMSKFEEYDLYVRNKDFLVSDSVITFTNTNGKLMALKPDVTLSIIKNSVDQPEETQKVFYNENVYRVSKRTGMFNEIMQTGLECFGKIDTACISEVLKMALDSLLTLSEDSVLEISDLDLLSAMVDRASESAEVKQQILKYMDERNVHELSELLEKESADPKAGEVLLTMASLYGEPAEVIAKLEDTLAGEKEAALLSNLKEAVSVFPEELQKKNVRIDFSVIGDMNYYNGITMKGFIAGIPERVLSGGQYDHLMKKMNRKSKAIGFAVYMDHLDRWVLPEAGK